MSIEKDERIVAIVEGCVEEMFDEVGEEFGLPSGDITSEQEEVLAGIEDDMYTLISKFVEQNSR